MKSNFLFPHHFKRIGWVLFILGVIIGVFYIAKESDVEFLDVTVFSVAGEALMGDTSYFSFLKNNIHDEITCLLLIIGALLIVFSKEKSEDEFISKIRLESLAWATYVNYAILIFSIIFIYEMTFFMILLFNMFTVLIFFIIRFNWALNKTKKQLRDEE